MFFNNLKNIKLPKKFEDMKNLRGFVLQDEETELIFDLIPFKNDDWKAIEENKILAQKRQLEDETAFEFSRRLKAVTKKIRKQKGVYNAKK